MPRDSNGLYTLPAGNPVISGTVITPTWANPTMDDLATEMTDSLSRSGSGGMLVPFEFADGDAGNPGMSWINEPSTGFYRAGSGDMRASVFGADSAQFTDDGLFQSDGAGGFHQVADARGFEHRVSDSVSFVKHTGNNALITHSTGVAIRNPTNLIDPVDVALEFRSEDNILIGRIRQNAPRNWLFENRFGGAHTEFRGRNAANDADKIMAQFVPEDAVTLYFDGVPKFQTLVDGAKVLGSLFDLDNNLTDEVTALRLRNSIGGLSFEQFDGFGTLFVRQIDANGLTPKNWGAFERDGAVSWRWNGVEQMRTRNNLLAGNSGLEVKDALGVLRPIGYGVMPRVDVPASTVRVLGFGDAGRRFRMQAVSGVLQLADFGDEAAINIYVSSATGSVIRVPATFILRYYGGSGGQINFNGPVDIAIDGGGAFTIVQFTGTLWEMWGGNLS